MGPITRLERQAILDEEKQKGTTNNLPYVSTLLNREVYIYIEREVVRSSPKQKIAFSKRNQTDNSSPTLENIHNLLYYFCEL